MTSIEKTTIPIPKALAALVIIIGFVTQYFTTQNAVKSGFETYKNETNLKIRDLENEDKMIWQEVNANKAEQKDMKNAIVSYIGTGLTPEDLQPKEKTFKQNRR